MDFFEGERICAKYLSKISGREYKSHILCREESVIRNLYCIGLLAIFPKAMKDWNEVLLHVGKIAASFSGEALLYQYLVKALKADDSLWRDFYDLVRNDVAVQFCVDALLIRETNSDNSLTMNIDRLCSKLNVNYNDCVAVVEKVLQKDYRGLLMLELKSSNIDLYNFLTYFPNRDELVERLTKKEGDVIVLGKYQGKPIEWVVLGVGEKDYFVMSKCALGRKYYGRNGKEDVVWDNCGLRKWLNSNLLNTAFLDSEKKGIIEIDTPAPWNPMGNKYELTDSRDKLFLLSSVDADEFLDQKGRKCSDIIDGKLCKWWLRTPGFITNMPSTYVDEKGNIVNGGSYVCSITTNDISNYDIEYGVRPAMVIKSFVLL